MRFTLFCSLLVAGLISTPASAALTYTQDFEGMTAAENVIPNTLSADGWLVGANVFGPAGTPPPIYSYFAFPAPNGGPAFSGVATGESGAAQGVNVLNVYNDYNNGDHGNMSGNRIEANVFRDIGLLDAGDIGETYTFSFDAKQGNIGGSTTANAFIKVLKTSDSSFGLLASDVIDTTALGTSWTGGQVSLVIDAAYVGETLQIGFTNTASNFEPSGNFYDNINVTSVAVPEPGSLALLAIVSAGVVGRRRRRS